MTCLFSIRLLFLTFHESLSHTIHELNQLKLKIINGPIASDDITVIHNMCYQQHFFNITKLFK